MKTWNQLTHSARNASPPPDLDVRAAIRAEISSPHTHLPSPSLLDDLTALVQTRWLQFGLATLAVTAVLACRDSLDVVNELAFIWQFQGPALNGI